MGKINLQARRVYTFPVENPISGDDIPRLYVQQDFLITEIRALKIGGGAGTFDWELRYDTDADQQGAGTLIESDTSVSNNNEGEEYLPPFDPGAETVIPAGNWVWLELANVSTGLSRPVGVVVIMIGYEVEA